MKLFHIPFLIIFAYLCKSLPAVSQVNTLTEPRETIWEKTKDKDDIVLYQGNILEDGAVPLKGHVVINHPLEKVVTLMADSQGKKSWLSAVKTVSILDQPNPYDRTEYYLVKMPFIVSDRTTVVTSEASVNEDQTEVVVKVFSNPNYPEKNDDYVRAVLDFGEVRLKSIDNGSKTIVSGIFYTDPQGYIPNWIVKKFTEQFVYNSLVKLRNRVGRNLYNKKAVKKYSTLIKDFNSFNRAVASEKIKKEN